MSKADIQWDSASLSALERELGKKSVFDLTAVRRKSAADMYKRSQTSQKNGTPVSNPNKYLNAKEAKKLKKYWSGSGELRGSASYDDDTFGYTKDYAPHVEYGHTQTPGRFVPAIGKRLVVNWVPGRYFLRNNARIQRSQYEKDLKEALKKEGAE